MRSICRFFHVSSPLLLLGIALISSCQDPKNAAEFKTTGTRTLWTYLPVRTGNRWKLYLLRMSDILPKYTKIPRLHLEGHISKAKGLQALPCRTFDCNHRQLMKNCIHEPLFHDESIVTVTRASSTLLVPCIGLILPRSFFWIRSSSNENT